MPILCLGINHHSAQLCLRERLAFSEDAQLAALSLQQSPDYAEKIRELVILSTCNRVELYALTPELDFTDLEAFLAQVQAVPSDEFRPHMYRLSGQEAIEHLFQVAAGLDSLVLGEPQILGQVIRALDSAASHGSTGTILSRLFRTAVHAGKRVRTETSITRNPASVSSTAVRLAAEVFPGLEATRVVILGAGEMASLVVEALRKRGVSRFLVVNRSLEHARELAGRWGGDAASMDGLESALESADIFIASASAPQPLVKTALVSKIMARRPERPLVIIDIAVPRNVEGQARAVPGVTLYDMDSLQDYLSRALVARAQQMPAAQAILAEEQADFMDFLAEAEMFPLIKELREQAEAIRQAELEKTLRRMPGLSDEERKRIEAMSEALVKKLLHEPITRLRAEAGCPHVGQYSYVTRSLFGLLEPSEGEPPCYYNSTAASSEGPEAQL